MELEERRLLAAARGGDEAAYGQLVEPHRRELHAHCYRMLASFGDAEDAVQEAFLRAWRGLAGFEGRSSVRTWLYAIATNVCLRMVERRPKRQLPLDAVAPAFVGEAPGRELTEAVWLEPYPDDRLVDVSLGPEARYDLREGVELAFVAALQHLPPSQRAALILRDVLGFSARETAEVLDTSVAAANSALQRARTATEERLPDRTQQATLRQLGDEAVAGLVRRYVEAMERGEVDTVVELLTEDATWSMPPLATWYAGREAIVAFLRDHALAQRWQHAPTPMNGQPAVLCYLLEPSGVYQAHALDVLSLSDDGRIAAVTAFLGPSPLARTGLPQER